MLFFRSFLMDFISSLLKEVFPVMTDKKRQEVVETLVSLGVQEKDDLIYLWQEDLANCLSAIQVQKFLATVHDRLHVSTNSTKITDQNQLVLIDEILLSEMPVSTISMRNEKSQSVLTTPCSSKLVSNSLPAFSDGWEHGMVTLWNKFPPSLNDVIRSQKLPLLNFIKQMTTFVVSEIFSFTQKPSRKQLRIIAQKIISKAPSSFADVINGKVVGDGVDTNDVAGV